MDSQRSSPSSTAEVSTEKAPRILVIEDDRHVRTLLCDLLTAWGYETDAAVDGREGLSLFHRGSHDIVLTDLAMPNVTGLDVAAGVLDQDPSVAVIMFTAFTGDLDGEGRRLGFTILRKPLDIDGLRGALRAALDRPNSI